MSAPEAVVRFVIRVQQPGGGRESEEAVAVIVGAPGESYGEVMKRAIAVCKQMELHPAYTWIDDA